MPRKRSDIEEDILSTFDKYAESFNFPMMDNPDFINADIRLSSYRSDSEWLIIFQEIVYSPGAQDFLNLISAFGNRVKPNGLVKGETVISPKKGASLFGEDGSFLLDLSDFEVEVYKTLERFQPKGTDYRRAKVGPRSEMPKPVKFLRLVASMAQTSLFLPDDALLRICHRARTLGLFLQMEDWHHPNIAGDERPSDSLCLQSLAKALAENTPSAYRCPERSRNTHWSKWASG